jgi:hypothetical protein
MLSSMTKLKDLSLIGHRVLSLFKLKSYLSLSALLALFLSFSLIGCGGKDSNNGGSEPSGFSVSFFDENLTLLEKSDNLPNGHEVDFASNSSAYGVTNWHFANDTTPVTSHTLTGNVNFYALSDVIEITNQTELDNIRTNLGGKYILLNDIPLDDTKAGVDNSAGWLPIGDNSNRFTGIFNGNGNTITNLWINRTSNSFIGLFGYIRNAKIKNLTVETAEGKEVKGRYFVGAIAGWVETSYITDSHSKGNVSGDNMVGGIAGHVESSSVTNSYSTGNVNGSSNVGGIAGLVYASSVTNSYSTGNVNGVQYIGGIAGHVESSSVTNSYSTGNVSGNNYVGGIAGSVESSSSITNSYSAGNVSGTGNYVGGIAGRVQDSSSVQNNAAINPSVTGSTDVNRVAGYIDGSTVTDNFALDEMSGSFTDNGNPSNHGTDKTEAELKQEATYGNGGLGWLFGNDDNSPWKIDENESYPYLYWE